MGRIKVAMFIPTLDTGGAEKLAIDLISNIDKNTFEPTLISMFPKRGSIYETMASDYGIHVKYLNKKPGLDILTFFKIWGILTKIQPDIVHTHIYSSSYVLPWMKLNRNVAWIHTVHSLASKELYSFHKPLMSHIYRQSNFVPVAISNAVKHSIIKEYKIDEKRIKLIVNGINISNFNKNNVFVDNKRNRLDAIEFISVARFNHAKNHNLLIDAFNKLLLEVPNATLTLVGDGELRPEIEKKITNLKLINKVRMVGITTQVADYLSEADVFVNSSTYEGLPLSILEAMASGLPIIATKVGGVPEILKDGVNGILVESEDVDSLVNAMIKLSKDSQARKTIGDQNLKDITKYDINTIVKYYEDIYINQFISKN